MAKKKDPVEDNLEETRIVRGMGDNASDKPIDGKKLKGFIEGLEKLDKKKDQVLQEISEVYADARAIGYDGKKIRKIIRERKDGPEKVKADAEMLMLYKRAIGMLDDDE